MNPLLLQHCIPLRHWLSEETSWNNVKLILIIWHQRKKIRTQQWTRGGRHRKGFLSLETSMHTQTISLFSSRYNNLLGSDFYSAYQQCFEPNSLYTDHKAIQRNSSPVLVQLQTKKVYWQQRKPENIPALIHLGGDVATAGDAPRVYEAGCFHRLLWNVTDFSVNTTQFLFIADMKAHFFTENAAGCSRRDCWTWNKYHKINRL